MKELPISRQQPDIKIEDLAKLPDADPNPVLCISATGEVLYSNQSGTALLNEWDCQVDGPSGICSRGHNPPADRSVWSRTNPPTASS